jgi:hypothetical protein
MVYFQTKYPNLSNFWRVLQWKIVYFMDIWSILQPFGICCGNSVYFSPFWYVVPRKIWQPWVTLPSTVFRHPSQTDFEADVGTLRGRLPEPPPPSSVCYVHIGEKTQKSVSHNFFRIGNFLPLGIHGKGPTNCGLTFRPGAMPVIHWRRKRRRNILSRSTTCVPGHEIPYPTCKSVIKFHTQIWILLPRYKTS